MSDEGSKAEHGKKKKEESGTDKKHALLQKLDLLRGMKRLKDKSKSGQGTPSSSTSSSQPQTRPNRTGTTIQAPTSSRPTELPRSTSLKGVNSRPELVRSQSLHVWRRYCEFDQPPPAPFSISRHLSCA
jgi:hypothetical protein